MHDIPELDDRGLRHFSFTMAIAVILLFGLFFPWVLERPWPNWPWVFAASSALWGLLLPSSLRTPYRVWMHFGLLLNRITTPLFLGIFFYLVLAPVGVVMRLFGRDAMARSFDQSVLSYRTTAAKPPKEKMEKPF